MENGFIKHDIMKTPLLLILMITMGLTSFAQKKELIEDKDLIIEKAKAQLDLAMAPPEGSIYLYSLKNPIRGEYTFDISFNDKSTVTSIFVVESKDSTIDAQNRFNSFLMNFRFNFKVPKGKSYKFRHTFIFN
jgi:hypothetical protein